MYIRRHTGGRFDPGFEDFVAARSSALLRTTVLLVGNRGDAEDILQTALLRVAWRWHRAREHPEAYVRQVLVNLARDHWRRSARRVREQPMSADIAVPSQPDHTTALIDRHAVQRALAELPQRQREVIVLRFFVDLSVQDTAAAMRTSEGTVKSHTSRALLRLRGLLDHHESDTTPEADRVQQR